MSLVVVLQLHAVGIAQSHHPHRTMALLDHTHRSPASTFDGYSAGRNFIHAHSGQEVAFSSGWLL